MNEREFIKVNTSIQTGSNVNDLKYDEDGNIEARIALRLPANLFDNNAGTRKIDKVTMATSKMRLSLENTPIASLPVESETVKNNTLILKPQLDVYPFSLTGEGSLLPLKNGESSFPSYKEHKVIFKIQLVTALNPETSTFEDTVEYFCNTTDAENHTEQQYYSLLKDIGIMDKVDHSMHLMMQNNHEPFKIENGQVLIRSLSSLCQILQDALENAISYASITDEEVINVYFIRSTLVTDQTNPIPDSTHKITISSREYYYWKYEKDVPASSHSSDLQFACKPLVRFNNQSLSISFDTAAFGNIIPIIWNTAFINTFENPQQLLQDLIRQQIWTQPPPKRVYKYGITYSDSESYAFTLLHDLTCRVMNIIADKTMRDCFSFLPWVELSSDVIAHQPVTRTYHIKTDTTVTTDPFTRRQLTIKAYDSQTQAQVYIKACPLYFQNAMDDDDDLRYFNFYFYSFYDDGVDSDLICNHSYQQTGVLMQAAYGEPGRIHIRPYFTDHDLETELTLPAKTLLSSSQYSDWGPESTSTTTTDEDSQDQSLEVGTNTSIHSYTNPGEQVNNIQILEDDPTYLNRGGNGVYWVTGYTSGISGSYYMLGGPLVGSWYKEGNDGPFWIPPPFCYTNRPYWMSSDTKYQHTINNYTPAQIAELQAAHDKLFYNVADFYIPPGKNCRVEMWTLPKQYPVNPHKPDIEQGETFQYDSSVLTLTVGDNIPQAGATLDETYREYRNCYTRETVEVTTITDVTPPSDKQDRNPNLKYDKSFYLLDGTTSDVTIGTQEPILRGERLGKWKITTTTTYEQFEEVDADVYKSGPGFTNVITDYETETTEFLVENPLGTVDPYGNGAIQYYFASDEDYAASDPVPWTVPAYSIGLRMTTNDHQTTLTTTSRTTTGSASGVFLRTDVGPYERVDPPPTTVEVTYSDDPSLEPGTTTEDEETRTREALPMRRSELITSGPMIHASKRTVSPYVDKWVTLTQPRPNQPGFFTAVMPNIATNAGISILNGYADTSFAALLQIADFGLDGFDYVRGDGTVTVDGHAIHYAFVWCAEECVEDGQTSKYVPVVRVEKYYEASLPVKTTVLIAHKTTVVEPVLDDYDANLRITYTWDNLPMVVLSPIQSIVLILDGMNVNQEFLPVNITEQTGSSLVSSVAVIENFYSLATTLRDLHDELIVIKDSFNDMATYNVDDASGKERTLTLTAKYITKDGSIHSIYIPPNGVFTVQLTFRLDFFTSSSTY